MESLNNEAFLEQPPGVQAQNSSGHPALAKQNIGSSAGLRPTLLPYRHSNRLSMRSLHFLMGAINYGPHREMIAKLFKDNNTLLRNIYMCKS